MKLMSHSLPFSWHSTSYKVTGQEIGEQYEYRIRAQNIHGESDPSKTSQPITLEGKDPAIQPFNPYEDDDASDEDEYADFDHQQVEIEPEELFNDRFDLHEEVGKGRFGVVYRCTDKVLHKTRAAKIIKCIKQEEKEKVRIVLPIGCWHEPSFHF